MSLFVCCDQRSNYDLEDQRVIPSLGAGQDLGEEVGQRKRDEEMPMD
jgi:hypothetical protein